MNTDENFSSTVYIVHGTHFLNKPTIQAMSVFSQMQINFLPLQKIFFSFLVLIFKSMVLAGKIS